MRGYAVLRTGFCFDTSPLPGWRMRSNVCICELVLSQPVTQLLIAYVISREEAILRSHGRWIYLTPELAIMLDRKHYRTKCIGVRVREADFARLQALADAERKSLGEWCRDVLLERAEASRPGPADQTVVLSEVLALRTIFLNSIFTLAKGKGISEDDMNELIERADSEKFKRAAQRLKHQVTGDGRM